MNTVKINKRNVKMVAHRGVRGLEPENSKASFLAAGNRTYYGIETDVHRTSDGKYIIIHDDNTDRVGDRNLPVEQSTFAELREVRLKGTDEVPQEDLRMPAVGDYARICRRYEKVSFLELKNPMAKEDIANIIEEVRAEGQLEATVFISFDFSNLVYAREILPEQSIMLLCGFADDNCLEAMKKYNFGIDIYYPTLLEQPEYMKKLKEMGFEVNCWTVNDKVAAEKLVEMGVDYITTDILE